MHLVCRHACAVGLGLTLSLGACKHARAPESVAKFDKTSAGLLDLTKLPPEAQRQICHQKMMILFVGNAEPFALDEPVPGSLPLPRRESPAVRPLIDVIHESEARLVAAVGDEARLRAAGCVPEDDGLVLLVRIIDGPNETTDADSEITMSWYRWDDGHWRANGESPMSYRFLGTLEPRHGKFELDLPSDVWQIAGEMLRMAPWGMQPTTFFDTVHYIFKTHGGLVLGKDYAPSLAQALATGGELEKLRKDARHVFLFDTHGPDGAKLSSGLRLPYWSLERGCRALARESTPGALAGHPELIAACRRSQKIDIAPALNTSGNPELNTSGNPELNTSGNPELNTSGNPELNTSGNPELNTSGNPELNTSGNPELGIGLGTVLGIDDGDALGAEKGLIFAKIDPSTIARNPPTLASPDGFRVLGEAVTVDVEFEETGKLWPYSHRGWLEMKTPPAIWLDSCYGDPSVGAWSSSSRSSSLIFRNKNSMRYDAVDYGALSVAQYAALPLLFQWAEPSSKAPPAIAAKARELVDGLVRHFKEEGLDAAPDVPKDKRAIEVVSPFKADEDLPPTH
jgi:hypothetical protein